MRAPSVCVRPCAYYTLSAIPQQHLPPQTSHPSSSAVQPLQYDTGWWSITTVLGAWSGLQLPEHCTATRLHPSRPVRSHLPPPSHYLATETKSGTARNSWIFRHVNLSLQSNHFNRMFDHICCGRVTGNQWPGNKRVGHSEFWSTNMFAKTVRFRSWLFGTSHG